MGELILAEQASVAVPAAGSVSLFDDGIAGLYKNTDDPSGQTSIGEYNIFRLLANGGAIGPAIADYFGANSSIALATSGVYLLQYFLWYLKTTAGTVTYTITNTAVVTNLVASYLQGPAAGIQANAAATVAGVVTATAAAVALPATASLTTAVNHCAYVQVLLENAASANVRLRVTESAGTITPLRGSFYMCRRISTGNVGTFVA